MLTPRLHAPALVASVTAIAVSGALAACGGGGAQRHTGSAARASSSRVVVAVSPHPAGHALPPAFLGLATENWTLTMHQFARTNLRQYMLALGPRGLIRIGGNSLDRSFWTSEREPPPAWSNGTANPASLKALAKVVHGTGWRVLLGVNLLHFDPVRAVDEARDASRILGSHLAAIEIGNEPDRYGISKSRYLREWHAYRRALTTAIPDVGIAGPDMSSSAGQWLMTFAREQARTRQVKLVTAHNYPLSACNGNRPTIAQLLSPATERSERAAADTAVAAGRLDGVPATIDETNSAVCWGAPGTSNVYASTLWSLDYTLLLARSGLSSVEFQGRIAGCAPYIPLCTHGHSSALYARPEFYGLMAVRQLPAGPFLRLANSDAGTLHAYALKAADGSLSVVLDNFGVPVTVALRLPGPAYRTGREIVLRTTSPAGLKATTGITLGGRHIGPDATLAPLRSQPIEVHRGGATVPVAAHSAVILRIRQDGG